MLAGSVPSCGEWSLWNIVALVRTSYVPPGSSATIYDEARFRLRTSFSFFFSSVYDRALTIFLRSIDPIRNWNRPTDERQTSTNSTGNCTKKEVNRLYEIILYDVIWYLNRNTAILMSLCERSPLSLTNKMNRSDLRSYDDSRENRCVIDFD